MPTKLALILGFVAVFCLWQYSRYYEARAKGQILEVLARNRRKWWHIRGIAEASDSLTYNDVSLYIGDLVLEELVARKELEAGEPSHFDAAQFRITEKGIHQHQNGDDSNDSLRLRYT